MLTTAEKQSIEYELEQQAREVKILKPLVWGFGAALVGAALWSVIAITTGYEIGYVGIAVAYLIGKAILKASGGVRSVKLQIMAVALSLFAILIAQISGALYVGLAQEGMQSQLLYALLGLLLTPGNWLPIAGELAAAQGPIGWVIIAITLLTAFNITNPKIALAEKTKEIVPPPQLTSIEKSISNFKFNKYVLYVLYAILAFAGILIVLGLFAE